MTCIAQLVATVRLRCDAAPRVTRRSVQVTLFGRRACGRRRFGGMRAAALPVKRQFRETVDANRLVTCD